MESDSENRPETPPVLIIPVPPERRPNRPISWWIKKFFACNPFYLVSAALLLYGVYLVSFDTNFLGKEVAQLAFNFSSLQLYEILLVGTAIFLARRHIWYDSVLLVCLENLLVLVPFILISQAALLSHRAVLAVCLVGAAAVLLRFGSLKHFFADLNLPRRALICGLVLLLVNVVLPLAFRHLHEAKIGTKPTEGAAYALNRYSWLVLLPALFALVNVLPKARPTGDLLPQRRWLPLGVLAFWLAGTATHVYSLSYVYNFDWEFLFALPVLWVVAWTAFFRRGDFVTTMAQWPAKVLLGPPLLVALMALTQTDRAVFRALTVLNLVAYLVLFLRDRRNLTALHLLLASGATLAATLAKSVGFAPVAVKSMGSEEWLLLFGVAYGLYFFARSRHPNAGVFGSLVLAATVFGMVPNEEIGFAVSAQCGLVFLLLHGLRWQDAEHAGAGAARILGCVIWFGHSLAMAHWHWPRANETILAAGGVLLGAGVAVKLFRGSWRPAVVPVAAVLVLLTPPGDFAASKLQATPAGFLAVAGSFALFAVGTALALTKPRWNHSVAPTSASPGNETTP